MKKDKTIINVFEELGSYFEPAAELIDISSNPNKKIVIEIPTEDAEGYELDEDGNRLSCCGDILDEDFMICPSCKEHC